MALEGADFVNRLVVERLMVQYPNRSVCPANEQDVVKISNAHLLHCVEEIFVRLPIIPDSAYSFRFLAEHESTLVQTNESFLVQKGSIQPRKLVPGSASLRPDNFYVLVRNHKDFEPARFEDTSNTIKSCGLEMKTRGGIPAKICKSVILSSYNDLQNYIQRETLIDDAFHLTPRILKKWETRRLQKFQLWIATGSADDRGGFGIADPWAQQLGAYSVGFNTQFIMALNYDELVLARFHRLKKKRAFGPRWNLGRGAGFCCQMAVYDSEMNDSFLPAIVGFLVQANKEGLEKLKEDEKEMQEESSDSGGSRRTESSVGDPMDVDLWA
jgi:hypothetical protein